MAQGFHSTAAKGYTNCAKVGNCEYFATDTGICRDVYILNSKGEYVKKKNSSTMWPRYIGPESLAIMLARLYKKCNPGLGVDICLSGCNFNENMNKFDIYMKPDNYGQGIISAYPVKLNGCKASYDCNSSCKDL